jgi:hypothetical protein
MRRVPFICSKDYSIGDFVFVACLWFQNNKTSWVRIAAKTSVISELWAYKGKIKREDKEFLKPTKVKRPHCGKGRLEVRPWPLRTSNVQQNKGLVKLCDSAGGVLNNVLSELPQGWLGSHGDFFVLVFFRLVQSVSLIFLCSTNESAFHWIVTFHDRSWAAKYTLNVGQYRCFDVKQYPMCGVVVRA